MRVARSLLGLGLVIGVATCWRDSDLVNSIIGCADHLAEGPRRVAKQRELRFLGKVQENTAKCRGGERALTGREVPWVDWTNYFATGDSGSRNRWGFRNWRGINGSLIDLEYQRVELIRFNLFDNAGTYAQYAAPGGTALKRWDEMRLPPGHPHYRDVGGAAREQLCRGQLIRGRTLTGICNDIRNPLMGSAGTPFARNVEFESTFPESSRNDTVRNRHGDRLAFLTPDPQVVSRKLFTQAQSDTLACADGRGNPGFDKSANCDYKKAPFFNVLAAFWTRTAHAG